MGRVFHGYGVILYCTDMAKKKTLPVKKTVDAKADVVATKPLKLSGKARTLSSKMVYKGKVFFSIVNYKIPHPWQVV